MMAADIDLRACRILIVEDEYLLADELAQDLIDVGVDIVGPASTIDQALTLLGMRPAINGAVLDINLGGRTAFPLADILIRRGVPIVFTTGYDAATLPVRFAEIPKCEKPFNSLTIRRAVHRMIHA